MHGVTVGWSALEARDPTMGVASGAFRPGPGYELVEPVFRLYTDAQGETSAQPHDSVKLARYYAARDRLGLTLQAPDGSDVATQAIHVADFRREGGPEAIELEVIAADPAAWAAIEGEPAPPEP
jgi:hypothetical protein